MALQQEIPDSGKDEGSSGVWKTSVGRNSMRLHFPADLLNELEVVSADDGREDT